MAPSSISKDNLLCMGLGSSSWVIINATWAQLSIFSKRLPEKFEFGAYCMIALIVANFIPILLSWRLWKNANNYNHLLIVLQCIIIGGMICCVLLSLFWEMSIMVAFSDSEFSLPLLLLVFIAGLLASSTNITYYPYLALFPASCIISLSFGSALGTIYLVLLSIIQNTGNSGLRFSVSAFYLLCLIPFSLSFVCLQLLEKRRCALSLLSTQPPTSNSPPNHDEDNNDPNELSQSGQSSSFQPPRRKSSVATVFASHATNRNLDKDENDDSVNSQRNTLPYGVPPPHHQVDVSEIIGYSRRVMNSTDSFAPTDDYEADVNPDDVTLDDASERYSNIDLSRSIARNSDDGDAYNPLLLSLSSQPSTNAINSIIIQNLLDGGSVNNHNLDSVPKSVDSINLKLHNMSGDDNSIDIFPSKHRRYSDADLSDGLCCCCCMLSTNRHSDDNNNNHQSSFTHVKSKSCCNRMCLPQYYWWIYDYFFSPTSMLSTSLLSSSSSSSREDSSATSQQQHHNKTDIEFDFKLKEEEKRRFFVRISCVLLVQVLISAVGFGIAPGIISKACSKVPSPHTSLFWSVTLSLLLDPLARITTYYYPLRSFQIIPAIIILFAIGLVVIASHRFSSDGDMSTVLTIIPIVLYSVQMSLFAYSTSSIWTFVHEISATSIRLTALIWVGLSTQLGAFIGGVIGFALVVSI